MAKRDLAAGETLDDYGMFMTYGEAVNADEMCARRYLPEGLVEGCTVLRDVAKDEVLTYDDVELPSGRVADRLRAEQYRHFRGETWLEERLLVVAEASIDGGAHRRGRPTSASRRRQPSKRDATDVRDRRFAVDPSMVLKIMHSSDLKPLGSVVIPAYDESAGIRRSLDALFDGVALGELDVVVVCNGCTDDTAALARSSGHPLRVIELDTASKRAALRAGDRAALAFPRIYLDADVVLRGSAARAALEWLRLALSPPGRRFATRAAVRRAPVRSYYRARSRVPALLDLSGARASTAFPSQAGAASASSPMSSPMTSGWTGSSRWRRSRSWIAHRWWSRYHAAPATRSRAAPHVPRQGREGRSRSVPAVAGDDGDDMKQLRRLAAAARPRRSTPPPTRCSRREPGSPSRAVGAPGGSAIRARGLV